MASIIADLYENDKLRKDYGEGSEYQMPMHDEVNPELKDTAEYCMQVTKAGFSSLMRDRSSLPGSAYRYMQILRDYGTGNQSEEYYINMLIDGQPKKNKGNTSVPISTDGNWTDRAEIKRKGFENINTQIVSVATNMKSAILGMMLSYEEDVFVNSVDFGSVELEEKKMYDALFMAQNAAFMQGMKEQFGIDLAQENELPYDVTLEELQVYKDMGGFRTEWAIAMEELIKYTMLISDWKSTIKRKWVEDEIDLNMIAGRCVYDTETGEERIEYIDPQNVVSQYSRERNFADSDYAGYFKLEKISKLVQKGFNRSDLVDAARRFEFFFGNYQGMNWRDIQDGLFWDERLLDYLIPVFHYYWVDTDVKRTLKTKNKYREVVNEIPFDTEVKPLSDYRKKQGVEQEEKKTRIRRVYQCSWIVDTDMSYGYGRVPNAGRKSKKEPILPIFNWRGVNTNENLLFGSITESIIPFLDALQLAWLKYQDSLIKSNPGGYLINLRLLQNLEIKGRKIDPIEAFEMFFRTGRMPYQDVPLGENYKGGSVLPMTKVEGNLGELMAVAANEIHFNLGMIEKLTGINPAPLGVSPAADQPVSATRMAAAGTNNVLRPYFDAMYTMKQRMADYASRRIQLLIRNNKDSRDSYTKIIGKRAVDMIKEMEGSGAEYGMYMEARPDKEEIQQILISADEALSPGRDGKIQINLSQYMYIVEKMRSGGNFKKLTRDLAFLIKRNEQEQQKVAEENVKVQAQRQQEMKQTEAQMDLLKQQGETKSTIIIDNNKAKHEQQKLQIEANLEYERMLNQLKLDLIRDAATRQQQSRQAVGATA